ncbi:MAG TPA: HAMP domain-containing sensor histidine kinase [Alphaproteobacteria bacterium]|nr:HAMP domain-containing sensor histidine kinase [Alphaproteobacteria bacterium]
MSDAFANASGSARMAAELWIAFTGAPYGVVIMDSGGTILDANASFCAITGYTRDELRHRPMGTITHPDDLRVNIAQINRLKKAESAAVLLEKRYMRKDGSLVPVKNRAIVMHDADGKPANILVFAEPVAEPSESERHLREALARAEAADRAKAEFVACISHELRTPLNAVIGFAELMQGETLGPLGRAEYRDYVRHIGESGRRLLDIVNDIIDLSRLEARELTLKETLVDLGDLVTRAAAAVKPQAERADLTLEVAVERLPFLIADAAKVQRIVDHLISNAIKFTPAGGRVDIGAARNEDRAIELTVRDTGIGMDPNQIVLALEPFRQVDGALERKYEGAGIGLALTRRLVELHQGTLAIESRPGVGTTVTVRFPASRTDEL